MRHAVSAGEAVYRPAKNIKLAGKWVKTERPWDVSWLLSAIGGSCEIPYDADDTEYDWSKDPWVVAQNLAIIADRIATAEGR